MVAVDTKRVNGEWVVYVHGGRTPVAVRTLDWVRQACEAGAGEVLLTSMDHDGTGKDCLDITQKYARQVPVPVIASGGREGRSILQHSFGKRRQREDWPPVFFITET